MSQGDMARADFPLCFRPLLEPSKPLFGALSNAYLSRLKLTLAAAPTRFGSVGHVAPLVLGSAFSSPSIPTPIGDLKYPS